MLFDFKVDFGHKSLSILFLLDDFAIFEEVLTVSKEVSWEFESLFLSRSFCYSRKPGFNYIRGFESFIRCFLNGLLALDRGTNREEVIGDRAVFGETGEIGDIGPFDLC